MADRIRNEREAAFVLQQAVRCSPVRLAKRRERSAWIGNVLSALRAIGTWLLFAWIVVGWMLVIPLFVYLLGGR